MVMLQDGNLKDDALDTYEEADNSESRRIKRRWSSREEYDEATSTMVGVIWFKIIG